jgi:hypothetical protein
MFYHNYKMKQRAALVKKNTADEEVGEKLKKQRCRILR